MNLKNGMYFAAWGVPALMVVALLATMGNGARAVPSFARQTGMECAACHVGAFGPQLTPTGRRFKLGGYTMSNGDFNLPLSAMAVFGFTHTNGDQAGGAGSHAGENDNFSVDQVSAFLAGKWVGPIGSFIQVTYDGNEHQVSLDNADIRAALDKELFGRDFLFGVSFNNNPTVSDVFNTAPAWSFPYMSSALTPGPIAGALINGGVEMQVGGASVYGYWDNLVYAEVGAYSRLSQSFLHTMGIERDTVIKGAAPYWRVALTHEWNGQAASLGTFGMVADVYADGMHQLSDKYTDIGVDATYQYLGSFDNVFSVNMIYVHEQQDRTGSFALGLAANPKDTLNDFRVNASWYHDKSYGLTVGYFDTAGRRDSLLYQPGEIGGSLSGAPNTAGYIIQADFTPFGKDDSWARPWANLRFGLQYTGYTKFNGGNQNYDGFGRKASDNNTLYLFTWIAF
jgi:hypothetical protein